MTRVQMGTLVSAAAYRLLLTARSGAWHQAALMHERRCGVTNLFVAPAQIDLSADRAVMAVPTDDGWTEATIRPLPRVFHNRLLRPRQDDRRALRGLNASLRVLIFNETNRWHRGMVLEMLAGNPALQGCVPPFKPMTPHALAALEERKLYLLAPTWGAIRRSGYFIRMRGRHLHYTRIGNRRRGMVRRSQAHTLRFASPRFWFSELRELPVGPGRPLEWRFYLLRMPDGDFALAGEVAKYDLLRPNHHRERCWPLTQALADTFGADAPQIAERLRDCALTVMRTLVGYLPGIAHAAVDFWLDKTATPQFADITGAFRLNWLERIGETQALQRLRLHPATFARTLLRSGVERLDVDFGRSGG